MLSWNESVYSMLTFIALKSTAVLALAWLIAALLWRQSAATRHLVWTAAFAALLALPLLSLTLPSVTLPISNSVLRVVSIPTTLTASPARGQIPGGAPARTSTATSMRHNDWRAWLLLLWAAGTAVGLLRMLSGWSVMWRTRHRAQRLSYAIDQPVEILETARGSMPMTFGLFRPAILLPADATEWSEERRRLVLLHELAHVTRGDAATHLFARVALHLHWWNPLAWMAWREFVKERERAADDLVLGAGASASDYAGHLLEIARVFQSGAAAGWTAVAMARRSQLEGRLVALLESGVNRSPSRRAFAGLAALAVLAVTLPLAILRAEDRTQVMPADVDATFRAAAAAKDHQMLDDAAQASAAFLKYDLARKLLDASLAIRGDVSGQQSVEYGIGLVKIGDLERNRGNLDEARAFYTKAASVLGNRPEAARPLIALGTDALTRKARDQSLEYFERAQTADPTHAGMAMMWQGIVKASGHPEEAELLYRNALAIEAADSAEAATTSEVLATFLDQHGSTAEAASLRDRAKSIRIALGAHVPAVSRPSSAAAYHVGSGILPPSLIQKVEPEYSEEARLAKYQGTAVVAVKIGTDGTAQDMRVVRSLGFGLDDKAVQAISQWHFKPGTKDGEPVTVMATIEVNFRLL
jgi:TonB family protein